jgi:serine/threonine-protein kinase
MTGPPRDLWSRLEPILECALELEPETRTTFLEEACRGDARLRREVEAVLEADRETAGFLSGAVGEAAASLLQELEGRPLGPGSASRRADPERFLPGTLFAKRFRIVGLLGRGGMGEVYRADDLKLGQPVALKFLPAELQQDKDRLRRLLAEVRIALKVSHPNVCRVYDVGESAGQHFISMEYVDGEDLASLLRRIGRLPRNKAVEISQQICAGLAAAHDQEVLHRDLKPANIMIDGRGRAKITDFGLAQSVGEADSVAIIAGTPGYMAPEQLAGGAVSARSDIYALGVVLYELFTGRRAFEAANLAELARLQEESRPPGPSSVVDGIEPAIDRVILACLARQADQRPESALAVAAALPGSDPLALALAAGETPSPELVAAVGGSGVLPRWVAWTLLGVFLGALAFLVYWAPAATLTRVVPLPNSPEILGERARTIATELGYPAERGDRVYEFAFNRGYLTHLDAEPPTDWLGELAWGRPPALVFRYHQSPDELLPPAAVDEGLRVLFRYRKPASPAAGTVSLELDPHGRLRSFAAVPEPTGGELGALDEQGDLGSEPDWSMLFDQAGLSLGDFTPVDRSAFSTVSGHSLAAWQGVIPERPDIPILVEATADSRRLVSFRILEPWERSNRSSSARSSPRGNILGFVLSVSLVPLTLVAAAYFARRNLRRGRVDRRGALRLAFFFLITSLLAWLLDTHHVAHIGELSLFVIGTALAAYYFGTIWLFYVAVEPYARSYWPEIMTSSVRFLEGRLRDPLIGRHLLIGCLLGAGIAVLMTLRQVLPQLLDQDFGLSWGGTELDALHSVRRSFVDALSTVLNQTSRSFYFLTALVLLRAILRRKRLAVGALFVLLILFYATGDLRWDWLNPGISVVAALFVLFRFGWLPVLVGMIVQSLLLNPPLTWDLSAWYADRSFLTLGLVTGLALYGFYTSLGGRALLRDELARG